MKAIAKLLACMLVCVALTGISAMGWADEDPGGTTGDITDSSASATNVKYTVEEFDALSDQGKRDVYFNNPQQLPDNYDSIKYRDIMHPEQE